MKRIFIFVLAIAPIGAFAAARTVHVVSRWIRCGCGIVYGNSGQHVSQWIYVRRYGEQLPDFITGRVVHNVCACGCILYRRHWHI